MSVPPKRSHEEGGHSSSSKYPHEDMGVYPKLSSTGASNEYNHPHYETGQDRIAKIPRTEARDSDRRSPLNSIYRMPSSSSHDSHMDSHPPASESRMESRDSKDNTRMEAREFYGEAKRDTQSVKGDKDTRYDNRGDDNKEVKYDRESYNDVKGDPKLEKEGYGALNWKESKEYLRGKRYSESPSGSIDQWHPLRGNSQGPSEVGKDISATKERDYAEGYEATGENRIDSKGEDQFKEKDRKRKDLKHRDWGDRDKERSDRRSSMQVGNSSSDYKESAREERESEKWERDRKDLSKDKEKLKEREKDHIKREPWNGVEKEGLHNEKELGEGSAKVLVPEQENSALEQKKQKEFDSWKNVEKEARDRRRDREVDMEGDRPEKRSRCYDKESDDGCADGEGTTEREREVFNYGVQQRKRMLRPRGSPQVGNREPRFRSRPQDNEGSQGKSEVSSVVYKVGECMQELIKLWKEFEASQADKPKPKPKPTGNYFKNSTNSFFFNFILKRIKKKDPILKKQGLHCCFSLSFSLKNIFKLGIYRKNRNGKAISLKLIKACNMGLGVLRQNMFVLLLLLLSSWVCSVTSSVSYDNKAIIVNGQRRILMSGSIHYPRSTPEMWPDLIQKAKDGGLDVIQTYVFWNGHEPSPGKYYFEDRYDLVRFIKLVQQAGLLFHLRIGPYVCAEWNYGGFPVWLKYVPGIEFRTDNEPFKAAMQKFTEKIVSMMKAEKLFQTQGGPIILSQIENEFGPVEWEIGAPGKAYTKWAAEMAVGLNTGVPWVMCKQDDAPDPVINTWNGFYSEFFKPNSNKKPKMWTENWTGWFTEFGGAVPQRPAEDLAFSVARFIQIGGSFVNYYMYHGGTNFGRTAGGPFIATSYDYDAPIDEYGLIREPKWGHLRDLHKAIKLCEPALVSADPTVSSLGNNQEAHVFRSSSGCAAFLANYDTSSSAKVTFGNTQYDLPPWSISILPDCKTAVYNTARLGAQSSQKKMIPVGSAFSWQSYNEETASSDDDNTFSNNGLWEQVNVTGDNSDYLWYMTDVNIASNEGFLKNGQDPLLTIWSAGHALQVFINGQLAGTVYGQLDNPKLTFSNNVKLRVGVNKISLLSIAVGLPNVGTHFEKWNAGVLGPVTLKGLNEGTRDLSKQTWSYKIGLKGEALSLHTVSGSSSVEWVQGSLMPKKQPMTWYKTIFNAPGGNDPLALDMSTMGKGLVWINGQSIGRHWPGYIASGNCGACNYAGTYSDKKCKTNCGEPTQRWYHVPRSWLNPSGNLLVVFEEWGGDPTGISLVKRTTGSVCADIFEGQPTLKNWRMISGGNAKRLQPKAHLWCPPGQKISQIKFASYGLPQGTCGSFREGSCHAHKSYDAFQRNCVGRESCSVAVAPEVFGGDPCPDSSKKLSVEAVCS